MKPDENPLDDLLVNVDKLTLPNRSKVLQDTIAGQPPRTVSLVRPPLLTQLEDAIGGTIGIGGSGSLPSERNMLDADALYRFTIIKSQIREWALDAHSDVRPHDPAGTLRAWYVKWAAKPRQISEVKFYRGKTAAWVEQIEAKLDPPRIRELPDRCPECNAFEWFNPADKHRYLHPLIIEYRPTGANMIQEAVGLCRACDKRWKVRELAYEIEQMFLRDWDEAIAHDSRRHAETSA